MCLVVLKPAGIRLPRKLFQKAHAANPHGAGYSYAKDGALYLSKGYWDMSVMWSAYLRDTDNQKLPALLHWRFATHGNESDENTQPFVMKHAAIAHNGIINWATGGATEDRSDSRILAEEILSDMDKTELKAVGRVLARAIGWSKLALLFPDGSYQLIEGSEAGTWKAGAWYSNFNHEKTFGHHSNAWTWLDSYTSRKPVYKGAFASGPTLARGDWRPLSLDLDDDDDESTVRAISDSFAPPHTLARPFTDAELLSMGVDPEDEAAVARLETLPWV